MCIIFVKRISSTRFHIQKITEMDLHGIFYLLFF